MAKDSKAKSKNKNVAKNKYETVRKMIFSQPISNKFKKAVKLRFEVNKILREIEKLVREEKETYFDLAESNKPIFVDEDLYDAYTYFGGDLDGGTPADWDYLISCSVERTINKEAKIK
jgi:hypothetical protein